MPLPALLLLMAQLPAGQQPLPPGPPQPAEAAAKATAWPVRARLEVGRAPHQIAFSADGATAYVAAAASDWIAVLDAASLEPRGRIPAAGVPLGVAVLPEDGGLAVTTFGSNKIRALDAAGAVRKELLIGTGPSLLVGPLPGDRYLVSAERENRLWVLDGRRFVIERSYPTGLRPFPPAATSDGRLAFVPNYEGLTVTVVDLAARKVVKQILVGDRPSGGAVLPGDEIYAVAVRGEDRVALFFTKDFSPAGTIFDGIGSGPFSVLVAPDGKTAFVNNTASHDISVVRLDSRLVADRIPVGEIPITMAVHPSGDTLWVACEGSNEVVVVDLAAARGAW